MAEIDVGSPAIDRSTYDSGGSNTYLNDNNSANADGSLDTIEIFGNAAGSADHYFGTFYASGEQYTNRDFVNVGVLSYSVSKATITGLSLEVVTGDILGWYSNNTSARVDRDALGYNRRLTIAEFAMDKGTHDVTSTAADDCISIYGTGETVAVGQPFIKRFGGVPFAALNKGVW